MIEMGDTGAEARTIREKADQGLYRSVYLPLLRGVVPRTLEPFDPVEQTLVTVKREATTVPTQALYFLNSGFVRKESLAFADRLLAEPSKSERQRIKRAYQLALGRPPSSAELSRTEEFLGDFETTYERVSATDPIVEAAKTSEVDLKPKRDATAGPAVETKPAGAAAAAVPAVPVNPDDMPRPTEVAKEDTIRAGTPKAAAWAAFIQAIYASAEFRFVR